MKKIISSLLAGIWIFLVCGCTAKTENITFTGKIEEIYESSLLVTTADDVGFDRAAVDISSVKEIAFNLIVGQKLKITILPEIRESYPVQATAVRLELITQS